MCRRFTYSWVWIMVWSTSARSYPHRATHVFPLPNCNAFIASKQTEDDLDEILVWSPKSEIMKRAKSTAGRTAPDTNET